MTQEDDAESLKELLATERAALLAADYSKLEAFAEAKAQLVERIAQAQPTEQLARDLQAQLTRNSALLQAASEGFRTVIDRLRAPETVTTTLYQADGSRKLMQAVSRQVERKV